MNLLDLVNLVTLVNLVIMAFLLILVDLYESVDLRESFNSGGCDELMIVLNLIIVVPLLIFNSKSGYPSEMVKF